MGDLYAVAKGSRLGDGPSDEQDGLVFRNVSAHAERIRQAVMYGSDAELNAEFYAERLDEIQKHARLMEDRIESLEATVARQAGVIRNFRKRPFCGREAQRLLDAAMGMAEAIKRGVGCSKDEFLAAAANYDVYHREVLRQIGDLE